MNLDDEALKKGLLNYRLVTVSASTLAFRATTNEHHVFPSSGGFHSWQPISSLEWHNSLVTITHY